MNKKPEMKVRNVIEINTYLVQEGMPAQKKCHILEKKIHHNNIFRKQKSCRYFKIVICNVPLAN